MIKYALWAVVLVTVLDPVRGRGHQHHCRAWRPLPFGRPCAARHAQQCSAAGVMILVQRPFRVGETISAGPVLGTVSGIGLFTTEMVQPDGLYVMVPNNELWNRPIVNFTRLPTRRFELQGRDFLCDSIQQAAQEELLALAKGDGPRAGGSRTRGICRRAGRLVCGDGGNACVVCDRGLSRAHLGSELGSGQVAALTRSASRFRFVPPARSQDDCGGGVTMTSPARMVRPSASRPVPSNNQQYRREEQSGGQPDSTPPVPFERCKRNRARSTCRSPAPNS